MPYAKDRAEMQDERGELMQSVISIKIDMVHLYGVIRREGEYHILIFFFFQFKAQKPSCQNTHQALNCPALAARHLSCYS